MNTDSNTSFSERQQLKYGELSSSILKIFYEVYNELGHGFLESVYRKSMAIALSDQGISVASEVPVPVFFRERIVGEFRADLLVEDKIILELKSARTLEPSHEAQLLHYLRSTEVELGLLLNFGIRPQFRRLLFDNEREKIRENPCKSVAEDLQ